GDGLDATADSPGDADGPTDGDPAPEGEGFGDGSDEPLAVGDPEGAADPPAPPLDEGSTLDGVPGAPATPDGVTAAISGRGVVDPSPPARTAAPARTMFRTPRARTRRARWAVVTGSGLSLSGWCARRRRPAHPTIGQRSDPSRTPARDAPRREADSGLGHHP